MKTKLSKIILTIMFTLLVVAGGGLFGACKKGSAKVNPEPEREPSVIYEDVLPLKVEDGTLVRYTGETNAVIDIPASYSIDEYGNVVAGDTYQITKIADNAFKGIEFFDAYIDLSNVTEIGESAFENAKNLTVSEMPNLTMVRDYAFNKAKVNFENMNFEKVTYFGERSFAETSNYEIPAKSTLKEVHAYDNEIVGTSILNVCANKTIVILSQNAFQNNISITTINFGDGICQCQSPVMGNGTFSGTTSLAKVIFGKGTYKLGKYMFANSGVRQVDMQNAYVEELPYACFSYCTNLVAVNLPPTIKTHERLEEVGVFEGCSKLKNVNRQSTPYSYGAQDGHTTIATNSSDGIINFCFASSVYCPLTSFVVPASVTTVQKGAFCGFNKLTELIVPFIGERTGISTSDGNGYGNFGFIFGDTAFNGATLTNQNYHSWYIPDSITKVIMSSKRDRTTAYAFMNMSHLTQVIIKHGGVTFTHLMGSSFRGCTGLTSVTLPDTTTNFGGNVFDGCSAIEKITVPENVTTIGSQAFRNCTNLVAVNLPRTISSFQYFNDSSWFTGSSKLKKITRNQNEATSGGVINFQFASNTTFASTNSSITIPSGITEISNYAFKGFNSLRSVTFNTTLTKIGNYAFEGVGLTGLLNLNFSNSKIASIGEGAFRSNSLTAVNLPGSKITSVGQYAFEGNTSLNYLTRSSSATSAGSGKLHLQLSVSSNCQCTTFHIPSSVTSIQQGFFDNFSVLSTLYTPVTTIEQLDSTDSYYTMYNRAVFHCAFGRYNRSSSSFEPISRTSPGGSTATYYVPRSLAYVYFTSDNLTDDNPLYGFAGVYYLGFMDSCTEIKSTIVGSCPYLRVLFVGANVKGTITPMIFNSNVQNTLQGVFFENPTNWVLYANGSPIGQASQQLDVSFFKQVPNPSIVRTQ